jgi:ABC-type multidrug transport system fused ATPase/permease subunit
MGFSRRNSVDPSKIGVVLGYTMSGTSPYYWALFFSFCDSNPDLLLVYQQGSGSMLLTKLIAAQLVGLFTQNEQNMNSVERILTFAELPPEGAATTLEDPPASWPDRGAISFKNVEMSYRKGFPLVLKDVSFDIRPGEKVIIRLIPSARVLTHAHRVGIVGRTGAGRCWCNSADRLLT